MFFKEKVNDIGHRLGSAKKRKSSREELSEGKSLLFLNRSKRELLEIITIYWMTIAYGELK